MTQYRHERPPTTAVEPALSAATRDSGALENRVRSLTDRVNQQADDIQELRRTLKKLQNEVRVAVNTFNLSRHG